MSIEIIKGSTPGIDGDFDGTPKAVMFCNTSGWAFGPTFNDETEAADFLRFFDRFISVDHDDPADRLDPRCPRSVSRDQLAGVHDKWREWRDTLPLEHAVTCKACHLETHRNDFNVVSIEEDPLCPQCGSDEVIDVELALI